MRKYPSAASYAIWGPSRGDGAVPAVPVMSFQAPLVNSHVSLVNGYWGVPAGVVLKPPKRRVMLFTGSLAMANSSREPGAFESPAERFVQIVPEPPAAWMPAGWGRAGDALWCRTRAARWAAAGDGAAGDPVKLTRFGTARRATTAMRAIT